jgi:hypothetical protein
LYANGSDQCSVVLGFDVHDDEPSGFGTRMLVQLIYAFSAIVAPSVPVFSYYNFRIVFGLAVLMSSLCLVFFSAYGDRKGK